MPRADYRFAGPPDALVRLRGRVIGFGVGVLVSGIVAAILVGSGVTAKAWLWLLLGLVPAAFLAAAASSVRQIKQQFPQARDPEAYDQKTLPPMSGVSHGRCSFEVRGRKLEFGLHPMLAALPVVILIVSSIVWFQKVSGLILVIGGFLVVAWAIALFVQGQISIVDGDRATINLDRNEIRFPPLVLTYPSRRVVRKRGDGHLQLKWREITSWVVKAGDSEDPAIYDIGVVQNGKKRSFEISRSLLRGFEHELLDAVRALGQISITLKDSADH
jgi:hypothetical protein